MILLWYLTKMDSWCRPFLGELQGSPKWQALLQHLQERQRLLEDRFPKSSFQP